MFDHNREIFRRRIEKLLDTSNTSRPIELRNRVIERKILNIIIGYKEGGISHTDIAKIIGSDFNVVLVIGFTLLIAGLIVWFSLTNLD